MRVLSPAQEKSLIDKIKKAHAGLVEGVLSGDLPEIAFAIGTLSSVDSKKPRDLPTVWQVRAMIKSGAVKLDEDAVESARDILVDAAKSIRDRLLSRVRSAIRDGSSTLRRRKLSKRDLVRARQAAARDVRERVVKALEIAKREWQSATGVAVHEATQEGRAHSIVKSEGPRAKVYKKVRPDCCRFCRLLYTEDGKRPRVFNLDELLSNGSNVGRRAGRPSFDGEGATEWLPVLGPAHPNCLLPGTRVGARLEGALVSWYEGPAVEIKTKRGFGLSVTPNHPVATSEGFVAAGKLREGDEVVSDTGDVWRNVLQVGKVDDDQAPPVVEDVVASLREVFPRFLASSSEDDLHGDARFVKGDVEVIRADGELLDSVLSARDDVGSEFPLPSALVEYFLHSRARRSNFRFKRCLLSSPRLPGLCALALYKLSVVANSNPLQALGLGLPAKGNARFGEPRSKNVSAEAGFVGQLLQRLSSHVALDEVVEIRHFDFSGHVYDLQSATGWIVADGIYVSNCQCELMSAGASGKIASIDRPKPKVKKAEAA